MSFVKGTSQKIGMSPGSLVYLGRQKVQQARIRIVDYDAERFVERQGASLDDCLPFLQNESVTWISITGIHNVEMIESMGAKFGLHPLLLEDVLNSGQRTKMDDYGEYLYLALKMLSHLGDGRPVEHEQVSLICAPRYVISLQESDTDIFAPVFERIARGQGRIRQRGSDYLTYALIDTVVDHYYKVLEIFGEQIEALQERALYHPERETLETIQNLKHEMLFMRKAVWPLREIVNGLLRGESVLIGEDVYVYLRDVYDHAIQVIDTVETYRDMLSTILETYLSSLSNRMNEVMKVLTIIATIFIPLTFVAGIYGMNFKYMPELEWPWAYPALWALMLTLCVGMLLWFKRNKWL